MTDQSTGLTVTSPASIDHVRANAGRLPAGIVPGGRFHLWRPRQVLYTVCDVDGTLVGPAEAASPQVVAAIARAREAGMRVGYATGRMRDAVGRLHEQIGAEGPHILHNGAEVRSEGRTLVVRTLTHDELDELLAIERELDGCYLEIYTASGYVASARDERARAHWEILGAEPRSLVTRAAELDDAPVRKATFALFDPAVNDLLLARLADLDLEIGAAGSPLTPDLHYVNVTRRGATKGSALRSAADHLGIDLAQVAAIGDAANDLSMLALAGTAVAMGQAPAQIVAAAHLVVPEVDAHGAAVALDALTAWNQAA